eukprot:m.86816 g.86816  ORF g.86816 m.86816 type:complete len:61 (+) comp19873_c0_seq1:256-438(+)
MMLINVWVDSWGPGELGLVERAHDHTATVTTDDAEPPSYAINVRVQQLCTVESDELNHNV